MILGMQEAMITALCGAGGGIVLGLAARLGRFCTLGAIEDALYQGSDTRLRMWGLAIGVAGVASFTLVALGLLDLERTIYHAAPFSPVASVLGGLLFGYGMSLAGNCGFGALARCGGGDLRSFVIVLVMGIAAYAMLSGPMAGLRMSLVQMTSLPVQTRDIATLLSAPTGMPVWIVGGVICAVIAGLALAARSMWAAPGPILWGGLAGLAVASGWAGTAWVARDGFNVLPVLSHTYTAPLGETVIYLMTSSGGGLSFGVGSVLGVLFGAWLGCVIKGHFRWEACEDPRELRRQVLGAVLMGFGAVLALGCTIGQGISAFSVLAYSAPLTLAAILAGAAFGLRQLITGFSEVG